MVIQMYMYYLIISLFINYTNNKKNVSEHTTYRAGLVKKLKSALTSQDWEQGQRGCLNRTKLPKAQVKKSKTKKVLRTSCGPKGNNILQNHMFKALHTQDAKHLNCSPFTMFTLFYFFLHHVPLSTPCSLFLCQRTDTAIHVATLFQPLTTQ